MNDWFEWNGVKCTALGIHVLEQPAITLPSERVTFTEVLGRSGALATLEGEDVYDDLTLTATCYIANPARIPEIASFLRGEGAVTFANRLGGFYYARIINQIPFEKILRGNPQCTFAVNFRCKPFWYKEGVEDLFFTEKSNVLTNPGTVHSQPKITVYGSGDFALTVAGQIMRLTNIEEGIILDTELQDALNLEGSQLLNDRVSGDFLTLPPGESVLAWLTFEGNERPGSVSKIIVSPRWRYL